MLKQFNIITSSLLLKNLRGQATVVSIIAKMMSQGNGVYSHVLALVVIS